MTQRLSRLNAYTGRAERQTDRQIGGGGWTGDRGVDSHVYGARLVGIHGTALWKGQGLMVK